MRLWTDTKDWMDAICKRLNMSLQDAAARANVTDAATFQQWFETGKPQKVTRQLRVWVKNLLNEAKVLLPRPAIVSISSLALRANPQLP